MPAPRMKLVKAFEKPHCDKCGAAHIRPVGDACRRVPAPVKFQQLLDQYGSVEELLRRKLLHTVETAAPLVGMNAVHIRRLCADRKMEHIERVVGGGRMYFFLPEQLSAVWSVVPKAA
jgi:hypothetical protein